MSSKFDGHPAQMLFGKIEDMLGRVAASMEKARDCLFSRQHADGYWCGELEADTTLESDYIAIHTLLGTGNQVVIFSGADLIGGRFPGFGATPLANFAVSGQSPSALVSVAAVNADGDSRADVAVGSGAGQESLVKVYPGTYLSGTAEPASTSFDPFGTVTPNGVFVG